MSESKETLSSGRRPRFVSLVMPAEVWPILEDIKDECQNRDMHLSERQRIGRDGVILALLAATLTLPEEQVMELVVKGVGLVADMPTVKKAGGIGKQLSGHRVTKPKAPQTPSVN
jgi:hypothetical protein